MRDMLKSWRGEKQMTRHVPRSLSARRRPFSKDPAAESGCSAAKSLVNTKVDSYFGFRSPLALTLPGHR